MPQAPVTEHTQPGTVPLVLFIVKPTIIKLKVVWQIVQHHGETPRGLAIFLFCVEGGVDENRRLCGVRMHIKKHIKWFFIWQVLLQIVSNHLHLMRPSILRRLRIIIRKPTPVHIFSLQIRSVITTYYPIRINYRYYPPLKLFPEFLRHHTPTTQVIYQPMDYKRRVRFAAVLTPDNKYYRLLYIFLLIWYVLIVFLFLIFLIRIIVRILIADL